MKTFIITTLTILAIGYIGYLVLYSYVGNQDAEKYVEINKAVVNNSCVQDELEMLVEFSTLKQGEARITHSLYIKVNEGVWAKAGAGILTDNLEEVNPVQTFTLPYRNLKEGEYRVVLEGFIYLPFDFNKGIKPVQSNIFEVTNCNIV